MSTQYKLSVTFTYQGVSCTTACSLDTWSEKSETVICGALDEMSAVIVHFMEDHYPEKFEEKCDFSPSAYLGDPPEGTCHFCYYPSEHCLCKPRRE